MPIRPIPPLQVRVIERVIFLRSLDGADNGDRPVAQDDTKNYRHLEDSPNQLRVLVVLNDDRLSSSVGQLRISLRGVAVCLELLENNVATNRICEIVSYTVTIPLKESNKTTNVGTTSIPFSIPVPSDLPPSVDADQGSNRYAVAAEVFGYRGSKSGKDSEQSGVARSI